jgi:hypothetical protein
VYSVRHGLCTFLMTLVPGAIGASIRHKVLFIHCATLELQLVVRKELVVLAF